MSVVHIAGFAVQIGTKARQLCAWCGERLIDDDYEHMWFAPDVNNKLPDNCCAKQPRCTVCDHLLLNHDHRGCHVLSCDCKAGGVA